MTKLLKISITDKMFLFACPERLFCEKKEENGYKMYERKF